jgi:transcriptional regulator with PAS, ATPase and Fis domain
MTEGSDATQEISATELAMMGVSTVFESLGRALVCVGRDFRIVQASPSLDHLLCEGAAESMQGRRMGDVFGEQLFGPEGTLRRALEAGQRREGWGASLKIDESGDSCFVSLSAAPVIDTEGLGICDPRVAFIVVLRPAEDAADTRTATPMMFAGMVARAARMRGIFRLVEQLSESDATVLVTGESGTGKELVARAVHSHSPRRRGPFVAVNCGALPGELLESELFGHVRGAFTGAVRDRVGRFELAAGGTLFLDEIAELPLSLQVKLLRVLQERSFERIGESTSRVSDARVIAATNQDLRRAVATRQFRPDLYYRLRVVPIEVPPLRDRREDVEPLAQYLLDRICRRGGRALRLSPDALRLLLRYAWPGNVRELENALEYAAAVCAGQTVLIEDLPVEIQSLSPAPEFDSAKDASASPPPSSGSGSPAGDAEAGGHQRLLAALHEHRWNRVQTAEALGISRTTLWRRMRELELIE